MIDLEKARCAYDSQKSRAKSRGIGWEFNFQTWVDWWGADIERRGSGPDDVQMQRFADTGPYAAWNVRKGTPKDNAKTRGHMQRLANTMQAKADLEAARDAAPTAPPRDELPQDEAYLRRRMGVRSSFDSYTDFRAADKGR
jgi:hypothetical protein